MSLELDQLEEALVRRVRFLEVIADSVAAVETFLTASVGKPWSMLVERKISALPIVARTYCHTYALKFPHPYVYVYFCSPQHLISQLRAERWTMPVDLHAGTPEKPRNRIASVHGGSEPLLSELKAAREFDLSEALVHWSELRDEVASLHVTIPRCIRDKFYVRMG